MSSGPIGARRCGAWAAAVGLLLSGTPTAQAPAGAPVGLRTEVATSDPAAGSPAEARLELARSARAAGDAEAAIRHGLAALELHPASPAILREILAASESSPDARAVFGLALHLALCDARGRPQLERSDKDLLLPKDDARGVAAAQAAAVVELARAAGKLRAAEPGSGVVARFLADLAFDLGRDAPAVLAASAADIDSALADARVDHDLVFRALRALLAARVTATVAAGDAAAAERAEFEALDRGVRAARILAGLAAQVGFGDQLEGPEPPALGGLAAEAREALSKLQDRAAANAGEPWTLERLRALGTAERADFTARHATWARPGVGVSPNGLYIVRTTCGYETLVGALATVEQHHARLAQWFGGDPFRERPGLIRIEPEHDGLEASGTPFWWAGGFQSGDVTVVRFAWGSIAGLGRTLTHELTHRFDGTLHPFLPSWLTEGRAVWTGRAYGRVSDAAFVENHLSPWAIQTPFVKGYGGLGKLTKLLDGTIDDYRDNYPAGYALFTYLKTWVDEAGTPLFAEPLGRFLKNGRGGRGDPVGFFAAHFADGEDGRPDGMQAFADGFGEFLRQCYRYSWGKNDRDAQNAFIEQRYQLGLPREEEWNGRVMDAPTFSWARSRAEPWFGQAHALAAARLLAEVGETKAAAAAACWSLQVDGWHPDNAALAVETLEQAGLDAAAWVAASEAARRIPSMPAPDGPSPLLGRLSKTKALSKALSEAASEHRAAGRAVAEASLAERHDRLAQAFGLEAIGSGVDASALGLCPGFDNPHELGVFGWVEDGLTGFEERRVAGLWYETGTGDIHVGRAKPKDTTGGTDRAAHQRHAFVRSAEWMAPGRYVLRTRIHFTTSYVSGAVVLGWTRRDHNVRIGFEAGDLMYAIGRSEAESKVNRVRLRFSSLWERDGPLPGGSPSHVIEFDRPSSYVDLEIHVDGPTVECWSEGERVFSYTTPTLSPLEGSIGFAAGQGAYRVQAPTVQRLDRGRIVTPDQGAATLADLVQRELPGAPRTETGAIVVWIPSEEDHDYLVSEVRRAMYRLALPIREKVELPQEWCVMLPPDLPPEVRKRIDDEIRSVVPEGLPLVEQSESRPGVSSVWVLFVDAQGFVRSAGSADVALPDGVRVWARHYRPPVLPGARALR
jgi:hypothetical protein